MKKRVLFFVVTGLLLIFYSHQAAEKNAGVNPFFLEYNTPFNVPPFDKIKEEHYLPAFKEGMKDEQKEVDVITGNIDVPTFEIPFF